MDETTMTIGELARAAGVNASTIRYYERTGVLPPADRVSGRRSYEPAMATRLRTIRAAQQAGFSLDEIKQLIRGADEGRAAEELRVLAERKLPEVDALIERARVMRGWLELARGCRCGSLDACELFAVGS